MISSMYTAVSGLNAEDTDLSVIGNNIANENTVGFKGSTTAFGDVLSAEIGGQQVGSGVRVDQISPQFTQGALETTSNSLNMAIEGDGFFVVNGSGGQLYTRAGEFTMDKDGNVVDSQGNVLQGYLADSNGNISGSLGNMTLTVSQVPAKATASVNLALNLQSTSPTYASGSFALVGGQPTNYDYSTSATVYDVLGGSHEITAYFTNTGSNAWQVNYVYTDPTTGNLTEATSGGSPINQALTFNSSGALTNDNDTTVSFNFGSPQNIKFDFGTSTAEGGTGLDGTTQFASDFSVLNVAQDGYSTGTLQSYNIDKTGVITGTFTNGQQKKLGEIALARFAAPTNLQQMDGNLYAGTQTSGQAIIGKPETSGLGSVNSGCLEESNVDLSDQFVKMIAAQSGYEANSKMITTMDQLMQTLVNMKQ